MDLTTLRRLKKVSLNRCRLSWARVWSPQLTELRLEECHALTSVDVRSAAATSFEWRHLIELATVQLTCPNLEHLALEDCDALKPEECGALTGSAPLGLPKLRRLSLQGCEGFTAVTVVLDRLEELDLGRCRAMRRAKLTCKSLAKLRLGECDSLREVSLSSDAFRSLNLGTCARLERLTLHAPNVHSLDLTGCGSLREAALTCPALTAADCTFCLSLEEAFFASLPAGAPSLAGPCLFTHDTTRIRFDSRL